MDKVFAIQNCGISGSVFLQSLFDGHPQMLSLPALNGQTLLPFWERHEHLEKHEILHIFLKEYNFYFEKTNHGEVFGLNDMGPNNDEVACIDKALFTEYLIEEWQDHEELSRKRFVVSIFKAYNRALGRAIDENGYLLYPIHSLSQRYAKQLVEDFAEVKFLHMIREPVQNVGSLANHVSKNPNWKSCYLLSCCIAQIFCDHALHAGFRDVFGLTPYVKDTENGSVLTRALRLEDVHKDPRNTLQKVCNWLNIEWQDSLLESTFDGKLWHNRPETIRQTGIGLSTISQKHAHLLNKFDKFRIEYLSVPFKRYYGYIDNSKRYSKIITRLLPILLYFPFKMELNKEFKHENHFSEYLLCRKKWSIPAWKKLFSKNEFIKLL